MCTADVILKLFFHRSSKTCHRGVEFSIFASRSKKFGTCLSNWLQTRMQSFPTDEISEISFAALQWTKFRKWIKIPQTTANYRGERNVNKKEAIASLFQVLQDPPETAKKQICNTINMGTSEDGYLPYLYLSVTLIHDKDTIFQPSSLSPLNLEFHCIVICHGYFLP